MENDLKITEDKDNKQSVFLKTMSLFKEDLSQYLNTPNDVTLLQQYSLSNEALNIFKTNISSIINYCKEKTESIAYRFSSKKIEKLINRITENIPPNEIDGKPVELGDIFLSGWTFYYDTLNHDPEFAINPESYWKMHSRLSRLLLKAANLAYIQSYYESKSNAGT